MRLRSILVLLVVSLLVIPLVACGGDGKVTDTTAAATQTTSVKGAPVGEKVARMSSKAVLDAIGAGVKDGKVVRPLTAWVISSANAANLYFVAMEFSSSTENHIGLWATDDAEGAGQFWAINDVARDVTTFPKGDDAKPKITMDDAGAREALAKYNVQ
jgi:hypothetical protein